MHLTVVKMCTDPMCPKCGEEEETAYHFLGKCNAMIMVHHSIFGAYLMEASTSSTVYSFELCSSLKEIYITFGLSLGCTLAETDYGLSVGWLKRSSPNVKVKGKVGVA